MNLVCSFRQAQLVLAFIAAICLFFPIPVHADYAVFQRQHKAIIGHAKNNQPVYYVVYHHELSSHDEYALFLTLGENKFPDSLVSDGKYFYASDEEAYNNSRISLQFFFQDQGVDTNLTPYFDPLDFSITLTKKAYCDASGDGTITVQRFEWQENREEYMESSKLVTPIVDAAVIKVREALCSGSFQLIINALSELSDIGGRSGNLLPYPPKELVMPLWHFMVFNQKNFDTQHTAKTIEQLLAACVFNGYGGAESPSLEGFVTFSLQHANVFSLIENCAVRLEEGGKSDIASRLRLAVSQSNFRQTD